jgi:Na+-transporting NADH:ubiquinone oxidoreductase subunit B
VYLFGWRVLFLLALCNAIAFAAEFAFTRGWNQPVSSAAFVTATLFTLSIPPALPAWMAAVGITFSVVFAKMVFGGFGKNIFNPALTGRAFIYICFGAQMTGAWSEPFAPPLGGLAGWTPDVITTATPGMLLKSGPVDWLPLFLGNTTGVIGGTTALLAIAGGIYLCVTKAANYRIPVAGLAAYLVMQTLFWMLGVKNAANPLYSVMAGSIMIGMFYYATDPVSASQTTNEGRWIYGAFIGVMSVLITTLSAWPAGTMFSILLANMFAPLLDHTIKERKRRAQTRREAG